MVEKALSRRPDDAPLSLVEIQTYICPDATAAEGMIFLKFCEGHGLDPFLKDVYLIKYDAKSPASIVIGIQALLKRADSNPHYLGYQAGVVVIDKEGELQQRKGSLTAPTDKLIGGWATVRRDDWPEPLDVTVKLEEYHTGQSTWNKKPGAMIEKCAIGEGLRRGFPKEIERLYKDAGMAVEVGDVEEVSAVVVAPPELTESGAVTDDESRSAAEATNSGTHQYDDIRDGCTVHQLPWRTNEHGSFHPVPNGPICGQGKLIRSWIQAEATTAGLTLKDLNAELKADLGETLSKLSVQQLLDTFAVLKLRNEENAPVQPGEDAALKPPAVEASADTTQQEADYDAERAAAMAEGDGEAQQPDLPW